jgi:uncharacterized protein (DUF58 family)
MRVAMRIAFSLTLFLLVAGSVYYIAADEWAGSVMLIVLALAVLYLGLVFRGAVRRASVEPTPERMVEHELIEAEVTPTIWPFVISLGAVLVVIGFVVTHWVLIPGAILLLGSALGWAIDIRNQWRPADDAAAAGDGSSSLQREQ